MPSDTLIETVKAKAALARAHAPDVIQTGVETLRAAKGVVTGARDELKRTLKEGAQKIGEKLAHIATPTRKEVAEMNKAEVKAKKRAKSPRKSKATSNGASPTLQ
ncbi:MAG TPA: hypothetical protein VM240_09965 [Verrucomicrobiae bacterium]|nr:hypothetical protein [Verrucomicrobiae bacterium]